VAYGERHRDRTSVSPQTGRSLQERQKVPVGDAAKLADAMVSLATDPQRSNS
jgi:hypothetical protein